ncbi:hypothetical protein N311_07969, partial [Apaloderma vittatum]
YTPLIQFPNKKGSLRPKIQESLQACHLSRNLYKHVIFPCFKSAGVDHQPFRIFHLLIKDTPKLARTSSQKYRRKLVSNKEIEYI